MPKQYKITFLLAVIALLFANILIAQPSPANGDENLPVDYLSKEFHSGRREALREIMPANSMAVVLAFPTRTFSNDVEYIYHPNPDLYYFSGYKEPHSLLLIFKDEQVDSAGNRFNEILFVQKKDSRMEQWTGKRLGTEGVKNGLGFTSVYNGEELTSLRLNFSKFDKIILDALPADIADNKRDKADLFDLVNTLKQKLDIPADMSKDKRFDTKAYQQLTAQLREIKPRRSST